MTDKTNTPKKKFDRIADKLIDDLFETSDQELLAEAIDDYGDVDEAVADVKNIWKNAQQTTGKRRLQTAKQSLTNQRDLHSKSTSINITNISNARKFLRNIIDNKDNLPGQLTLAARNLDDLTDEDVLKILNDLHELGAISDKDLK